MNGPEASLAENRLRRTLGSVRASLRRAMVIEAISAAVTTTAGALIVGAALHAWGLSGRILAVVMAAALLVGWGGALVFALLRWRRQFRADSTVAAWLDLQNPDDATVSVLSALELLRDRGRFGESVRLAEVAVEKATQPEYTQALHAVAEEALARRTKAGIWTGVALSAAAALGMVAAPKAFSNAWAALGDFNSIEEALTRVPPEPRLGDFRLTYRYPAYAERAQQTLLAPDGFVEALPGTELQISTTARRPVESAVLLLSHGDGDTQKISVDVNGRSLAARLVISRAGQYRFEVVGQDGVLRRERRGHAIELEADEAPQVTLYSPEESPLEVNERDRVMIVFSARDDFALGESSVHWRVLGSSREGRVRLTTASVGRRRFSGKAPFDLADLEFKPGDRVAYTIEVLDNDTVNGPKAGLSKTQELRIYSKRAHHARVTALQQKTLDELVHILGDNLDRAFENYSENERYKKLLDAASQIVNRALGVDGMMREVVAAVRRDPLGRPQVAEAFDRARRDIRSVTARKRRSVDAANQAYDRRAAANSGLGRRIQRDQARMVRSLEKNVVYLADLLNDQRLIDAEALARELRDQQQALREALKEYKKAPTEEKRALIAEAIQQIRNRIAEITRELSKLRQSIPQDFVNRDALQPEATEAEMDDVERMLENGDLDAALEALDRMLESTERMLSQLQEGRDTLRSREYSEIQQKAQQLYDDLKTLEKAQSEVANQTEAMSRKMLDRMKDRLGDGDAFVDKQVARLELAKSKLKEARPPPFMPDNGRFDKAERRIDDGIRALQGRDFGAAREVLERADSQIGQLQNDARRRRDETRQFGDFFGVGDEAGGAEKALRQAKPPVEEVLKDIESLIPDPSQLLSKGEQKRLQRLREQQQGLENKAEQLGRDMQQLGEQLPIVGPQMGSMVGEAQGSMRSAEQGLRQGDAPGALSHQRNALDKLRQLQRELDKMGENGSSGQGGVPLPFGTPSSGRGGEQGEDGQNPDRDKVEIPKPEAYQAPAAFREDILEAAKQGTVERYRDAVRRYYEELVK